MGKYKDFIYIGITIIVFFFILNANFTCNPDKPLPNHELLQEKVKNIDSTSIRLQREIDSLSNIPKSNDTQELKELKEDYTRIISNDDSITKFFRTNLSSQRDSS